MNRKNSKTVDDYSSDKSSNKGNIKFMDVTDLKDRQLEQQSPSN